MERVSTKATGPDYLTKVGRWSDASVRKINVPFAGTEKVMGIDWDSDEYRVDQNDERWIIPDNFDIGGHEWYQNLPREEKIRIGLYRYAQVARVGSEFENALSIGVNYAGMATRSDDEITRYAFHEAEEEHRHVLMFRQFVTQTGVEPMGAPDWFRSVAWLTAPVARKAKAAFWWLVLSGEEPIDKVQRDLIKMNKTDADTVHPLMERVMKVHVEEEARHINFADSSLKEMIDSLGPVERQAMAVAAPVASLIAAKVIVKPSRASLKEMGVPQKVADELWTNEYMGPLLANARERADALGLRDGERKSLLGRAAWRLLRIDEGK